MPRRAAGPLPPQVYEGSDGLRRLGLGVPVTGLDSADGHGVLHHDSAWEAVLTWPEVS